MIESFFLGAALWWGVDLRRLALLAGGLLYPAVFVALLVVRWWRARPRAGMSSSRFCEAVASELRAGSSMRNAIAEAASATGSASVSQAARSGAPLPALAAAAAEEYPDLGSELAMCIERSAWLGAPAADLFEEVGSVAMARTEVAMEINIAMAPARATLLVLLVTPVIALWFAAGRGGLGGFVESGMQRLSVFAGLILCGLAGIVGTFMMRKVK
jgi:hypothetical protein